MHRRTYIDTLNLAHRIIKLTRTLQICQLYYCQCRDNDERFVSLCQEWFHVAKTCIYSPMPHRINESQQGLVITLAGKLGTDVGYVFSKRTRHGPLARYVKLRVRMRRECRERFPRHRRWAIPTCITARASRTCRDACRDRQLSVSFEIGGGGKRSRHSRRMRNLQFYVSGKRPIVQLLRSLWQNNIV